MGGERVRPNRNYVDSTIASFAARSDGRGKTIVRGGAGPLSALERRRDSVIAKAR